MDKKTRKKREIVITITGQKQPERSTNWGGSGFSSSPIQMAGYDDRERAIAMSEAAQ